MKRILVFFLNNYSQTHSGIFDNVMIGAHYIIQRIFGQYNVVQLLLANYGVQYRWIDKSIIYSGVLCEVQYRTEH